jgi:hypothetical protein
VTAVAAGLDADVAGSCTIDTELLPFEVGIDQEHPLLLTVGQPGL